MSTFLERLILERDELKEKLNNLEQFIEINNTNFQKLSEIQRMLLITQFHTMKSYYLILEQRLLEIRK